MPNYSILAFEMARSERFTGRFQSLLGQYAKAVKNGAVQNPTPASRALADRVQSDPGGMAGKLAISIASDGAVRNTHTPGPPVDSTLTDDQLDGIIQAIWNSGAWDNVF